jgi:hypothetical protein
MEECNDCLRLYYWLRKTFYRLLYCGAHVRVCEADVCNTLQYLLVRGTCRGGRGGQ